MGGGPASADVVRSSCILTFPEETLAEPVPVDAWYLHAVGLTFLRRLARDRVGDDMRIALLMQPVTDGESDDDSDSDASDADDCDSTRASLTEYEHEHEQKSGDCEEKADARRQRRRRARAAAPPAPKRYISVSSDAVLRAALEETFARPERVLVLHVISLAKVPGAASIHVRPEAHPNVSPEPVAPLGLVFPTLRVEGSVTRVPAASDSLLALSASHALSKSVVVPPARKSVSLEPLARSAAFVEEREYSWRGAGGSEPSTATVTTVTTTTEAAEAVAPDTTDSASTSPLPVPAAPSSSSVTTTATTMDQSAAEPPQKPALAAATPVAGGDATDDGSLDLSAIPVARVVGLADAAPAAALAGESDYVVLELQSGAGLGEHAGPSPTYFLSSTWHVQADEMGASMRLGAPARPQDERVADVGLDDSFVVLERRAL